MQSARFHPSACPACPPPVQSDRANNVTMRPRCQTQTSLRPPRPRPARPGDDDVGDVGVDIHVHIAIFHSEPEPGERAHSLLVLCFSYNVRLAMSLSLSLCPEFVCPAPGLPAASVSCVPTPAIAACTSSMRTLCLRPAVCTQTRARAPARSRLFVRFSLLPSVSLPVIAAAAAGEELEEEQPGQPQPSVSFRMMTLFLADAVSSQRILTLLLASFNL